MLKEKGFIDFTTFRQSYGYEEFIEGIKPVFQKGKSRNRKSRVSKEISYEVKSGIFKEFCSRAKKDPNNNYVFIIDEINRGNISKIFGELITLIEGSKRIGEGQIEAMTASLPYSGDEFGVPNNVYILGTMNTADRSIALMDTALRRRFDFIEMMPNPEIINKNIRNISISEMLTKINKRIESLYDREHTIGHAFFTSLNENSNIEDLSAIFKKSVIPLLQEYFYEDYEKIRLVLGDNSKDPSNQFINESQIEDDLFGNDTSDYSDQKKYSINDNAFLLEDSYLGIYKKR
ncbi:McrB family protein [Facklamia sp. P12955]|uniref:McrB family protein n=1 Tax=Facklamia sp. P12955 TaxID=3421946 RepID=UPI003D164EDA